MSISTTAKTFSSRTWMLVSTIITKLTTFSREEELAHSWLHRRLGSTFVRSHCVGSNNSTRSSFNLHIYLKLSSSRSCTDDKLKTCFSQDTLSRKIATHSVMNTCLKGFPTSSLRPDFRRKISNPFCHEQSVWKRCIPAVLKGFSDMKVPTGGMNSHGSTPRILLGGSTQKMVSASRCEISSAATSLFLVP